MRMAGGAAAIAVAMLLTGDVLAGKPGSGGGGESPDKIYYHDGAKVFVMNNDGTGKTELPVNASSLGDADASYMRHGGKRFFLVQQDVTGEVNWRGQNRYDLFAIDDTGVKVRLTNGIDHGSLRFLGGWRFCPDEDADSATISGKAHEMNPDGTAVAESGGVYFGAVSWDADGNISLEAAPALVSNAAGYRAVPAGDYQPNIFQAPAVSPDMTKIAVASFEGNDIRLIDIATNTIATVLEASSSTRINGVSWLEDGSRILFWRGDTGFYDYIEKIAPDGTLRAVVYKSAKDIVLGWPKSSPDSANVIFINYGKSGSAGRVDVYRVPAGGGRATNLTADASTSTNYGLAWRNP
jgi:hypothetical protein